MVKVSFLVTMLPRVRSFSLRRALQLRHVRQASSQGSTSHDGGQGEKEGRRSLSSMARAKYKTDFFKYPSGMVAYEDDYVDQAEYPEIDPETHDWPEFRKKHRKDMLDWYKRVQDQPNPEAKTLEINMPR